MKKRVRNRIGLIGCVLLISVRAVSDFSPADSLYWKRCQQLDFPIVHVHTENGVMPSYTVVYAPEGCSGRSITNNEKVPARMWMIYNGDTIYDSGSYIKDTSGVTIKVRGNTTASDLLDKKPYKLKLQKKADLLFRGNTAVYADKEWLLLRSELCETMTGNLTNRLLGMEWTPTQQPVFLFLNDNFRGIYMLSENVKRNSACRVNISKEGYLYEYDAYWWNEDFYIDSPRFGHRLNYTLKYPDPDNILPWQVEYLTKHIAKLETAYVTPNALDSAIDIPSYIRWLWVHDMLGNHDGGGSNIYLAKYDTTSVTKQTMICAWDFSGCFTPNIQWSEIHNNAWFIRFFNLPQTSFVRTYINLYDTKVKDLFDTIINQLEVIRQTEQTAYLDSAFLLDNQRWGYNQPTANKQFLNIIQYLTLRKNVIDGLMTNLKASYNGILTSVPDETKVRTQKSITYDVLGRPLSDKRPGTLILIRNTDGSVQKTIQ